MGLFKFSLLTTFKKQAKDTWSNYDFWRKVRQIAMLPPGKVPTRQMLADLQQGWGNESFVANLDYLEEVAHQAATTPGPILECGSGLTTLLLGILAGQRGVNIYTLEHISLWHEHVSTKLQHLRIPGVTLLLSPLRDYGDFTWYELPVDNLPDTFSLVICDGPPGNVPGGRYGLLPVLKHQISRSKLILLDDADRPGELEVLHRWSAEAGVEISLKRKPTGTFALVSCP